MKIAVVVFPGSNCDIDLYEALHTVLDADVEYVSHKCEDMSDFDAVMLPGGFSCVVVRSRVFQKSCLRS